MLEKAGQAPPVMAAARFGWRAFVAGLAIGVIAARHGDCSLEIRPVYGRAGLQQINGGGRDFV